MNEKKSNRRDERVTLRTLSQHLSLSPGTISKVLNNASGSEAISQRTKNRVVAAAREFRYRPNFFAQSLRSRRTYMVGVIVHELENPCAALLIAGIERFLRPRGYLCVTGAHRDDSSALEAYTTLFLRRGVEGIISVEDGLPAAHPFPTVAVTMPRHWPSTANLEVLGVAPASDTTWVESRRFLEQVGETAAETLLAQIEYRETDPLAATDRSQVSRMII